MGLEKVGRQGQCADRNDIGYGRFTVVPGAFNVLAHFARKAENRIITASIAHLVPGITTKIRMASIHGLKQISYMLTYLNV